MYLCILPVALNEKDDAKPQTASAAAAATNQFHLITDIYKYKSLHYCHLCIRLRDSVNSLWNIKACSKGPPVWRKQYIYIEIDLLVINSFAIFLID